MKRQHITGIKLESLRSWLNRFLREVFRYSALLITKGLLFVKKLFVIVGGLLISTGLALLRGVKFVFSFLKRIFLSRLLFLIYGLILGAIVAFLSLETYQLLENLPDPKLLEERGTKSSTKILDRNGILLYEIYKDRRYEPVKLEEIPQVAIQATLAIEDSEFYQHKGFRPSSMLRAAKAYVKDNRVEGASTITQQLVKNVLLTPERTFDRKIKELILAIMVEKDYSKDQILELYLNNISYGGVAWGIESASQEFFGKSVQNLNLAEASLLAGLPSAPSVYSPLNGNLDLAKQRQKTVLERMVILGYISQKEADQAFETPLNFVNQETYIKAPHFVFYVRSILEERYGKVLVEDGGLTVKTTLDMNLQEKVQKLVKDGVEANSKLGLSNGASVVLDAKTGGILAYVGSIDFFKEGWGAYDIVQALRQPGSSIKPVTYSLALSSGFTPASIILDAPVSFPQPGQASYRPVNYDGRYHGNVTLRQALANSYNIPAVKLAQKVGPENIASLGISMGLRSWEDSPSDYGLAITLGSKEVKLLELANAYGTLARQGTYLPTNPFLSVKDSKGRELLPLNYDQNLDSQNVLNPGVAFLMSDILSDNVARTPAFGPNSPLNIPGRKVAVKTGTTDLKRDNWTFGYTPSYVVGVWVGNNDNSPMSSYLASGLTGAAPIWRSIMDLVLFGTPAEDFRVPDNVILKEYKSCRKKEYFILGTEPANICPVVKTKKSSESKSNKENQKR